MHFDLNKDIRLENERALLVPLTMSHKDMLSDIILKDKDLMLYSTARLETEEDLTDYIDTALENRKDLLRYPFAVFDKKSNRHAGSTSFTAISNKDKRLEIGYTWIGYDFQGTGLNRAMKSLMLQYAFETLGFARVELKADARNQKSRRAMEKIGATYEGELRSHMLLWNGYRRNSVYYSILADEWPVVKTRLQTQ